MAANRSIKAYYAGKNVLITGGSGFLGKALIEKLLRSCPDVGKLYLLLRPKKGKSPQERISQITSNPLFDKLRETNPERFEKLIPIDGDASRPNLGLSNENRTILIEEVHIVYHSAASVRFDDSLPEAVFINVRSAQEIALLALEMKKIEVFMHVSTTYCNIEGRRLIEEKLYPPFGNWKEAIAVAESCDRHILNILSQKYIGQFANTYTYTKRLAEHCIKELLVGKVPTVICRPSVVVSSLEEPFCGWIDNFNGPCGLLLAGGSGVLRTVYGNVDIDTDYCSVDNITKLIIVATWHKAITKEPHNLEIYHGSKGDKLKFLMGQIVELGKRLYWDVPFERKIWFPRNSMTNNWLFFYINVLLFHLIPAVIIDLLLRAFGQKPFLFKVQRKIYIANMAISYFMLNDWNFSNVQSTKLLDEIPTEEVKDFNFYVIPRDDNHIYEYYKCSCDFARVHLTHENKEITEGTHKRTRLMYYLDILAKAVFFMWTAWELLFKINILGILFNWTCNYWNSL